MSKMLSRILQNQGIVRYAQNDYNDIVLHYDHHLRVARARWLKEKFGKFLIPRDLFQVVVGADVLPEVLDYWYTFGGLNCVYYRSKSLFGGGDDLNSSGIRDMQEEIARRSTRTRNYVGEAGPIGRTFELDL